MMTFLSRWFGLVAGTVRDSFVIPARSGIARATDADVAGHRAAASDAFVAGEGARIYSLDAFRRAPAGSPRPRAA
ncbi:MAG TPA: hypothetical protein VI356_00860 [Myxococcales bacterium]